MSSAPAAVQPYNFTAQDRIIRGRLPTLEILNERFVRLLRPGLFQFMRRHADVSVGPVRVLKYGEYARDLRVPASLNLVHVHPLRGTALVVFSPELVFLIVETLFGGDGRTSLRAGEAAHEPTATEQSLLRQLLDLVGGRLQEAWQSVQPVTVEYLCSETNSRFAYIAAPSDAVVVTSFQVEIGSGGGSVDFCFPYAMLEPVLPLLRDGIQGERPQQRDCKPVDLLAGPLREMAFRLQAEVALGDMSVAELYDFCPGRVVPLPLTAQLAINGLPLGTGDVQLSLDRRTVLISEISDV